MPSPAFCIPMRWDQKTIIQSAMTFLNQKKDEIAVLQKIWEVAQERDFYCASAKIASKKVKIAAKKARTETEGLDKIIRQLLDIELAKDSLSITAKKLSKLAVASNCGLNYFTSILDENCHPTFFKWGLRASAKITIYSLVGTCFLTGMVGLASEMFSNNKLPSTIYTPLKISAIACVGVNAFRLLNFIFRVNWSQQQMKEMKILFEKALCS